jgi:hypothetical protein
MRRPVVFVLFAVALGACGGGFYREEIQGNNTGGIIPASLVKGGNAQALASAHCAKYGLRAKITFSQADTGGEVVFICEGGMTMQAPAAPAAPPPDSSALPATKAGKAR